jgi:hypothetical protein
MIARDVLGSIVTSVFIRNSSYGRRTRKDHGDQGGLCSLPARRHVFYRRSNGQHFDFPGFEHHPLPGTDKYQYTGKISIKRESASAPTPSTTATPTKKRFSIVISKSWLERERPATTASVPEWDRYFRLGADAGSGSSP